MSTTRGVEIKRNTVDLDLTLQQESTKNEVTISGLCSISKIKRIDKNI